MIVTPKYSIVYIRHHMEDPLIEKADSSSEPSKAETRPEEVRIERFGFLRCLERIFLPSVEPENANVDKSE